MLTGHAYRACCSRLEAFPRSTRRTALLPLTQHLYTQPTRNTFSFAPSVPDNGGRDVAQARVYDGLPQTSRYEASIRGQAPSLDAGLETASSGSTLPQREQDASRGANGDGNDQTQSRSDEQKTKIKSRLKSLDVRKGTAKHRKGINKDKTGKSPAQLKHDAQLLQDRQKKQRLQENYLQWGYLRHQHPEAELPAVKRAFNQWKNRLGKILEPTKNSNPPAWASGKWLFDKGSVPAMRHAWEELDVKTRQQMWPTVMLSTLCLCPERASMVLHATFEPRPPSYATQDVLLFLAQRLQIDDLKSPRDRMARAEETLELLVKVYRDSATDDVIMGQRAFGLFARKLPCDQTEELYSLCRRSTRKLHPNTALHFARKLAGDMSHKQTAFDILKDLVNRGVDPNLPKYSSVVTALLHCKHADDGWSEPESSFSPKVALQWFIENGFAPNVIGLTAFLDTLCQRGEVGEAIRLALLFAESGLQLDTPAYVTTFRGAKSSLNIDHVVAALDVAKAANAPYVKVLNNALHAVFYFAEMESRERKQRPPWVLPLFDPMLRIYAKKFDLEPLQWLLPGLKLTPMVEESQQDEGQSHDQKHKPWKFYESIVPVIDRFFSSVDGPQLTPDSGTLATMLRAYIKSIRHPNELMSFYSAFKSRLEERGKPNIALELVKEQSSLIHDTLIMATTEQRGFSRQALHILGDMLADHKKPRTAGGDSASTSKAGQSVPVHPAPSLFTFSILLRSLMVQGEQRLLEQIVGVMRENGLEPNLVIWNLLTKGYAHMQDIAQTIGTLQELEGAGFKPDVHTFRAFGKLKNQDQALELMERIIDKNKEKMAMDSDPAGE